MLNKWLDLREAEIAWQNFCNKRYYRVTERGSVVISEMIYPPTSAEMLAEGHRNFVTTFMLLRGWRLLPGSEEWV